MKNYILLLLTFAITKAVPSSNEEKLPFDIVLVTGGCHIDENNIQICDNKDYFRIKPVMPPKCTDVEVTKECLFEPSNTGYLNQAISVLNEDQKEFDKTLRFIQTAINGQFHAYTKDVSPNVKKVTDSKTCQEAFNQVNRFKKDDYDKFYGQLVKKHILTPKKYNSSEECLDNIHDHAQKQGNVMLKIIRVNKKRNEKRMQLIKDVYSKYRGLNSDTASFSDDN